MATTPNFNWSTPDNTGLVRNGALDIRTLGNSIDASMADLKGGTTGQVLSKATNTDMDFTWTTAASGTTFSGVRLENTAAQTVSSGAWTTLTFNTEVFDTDAFHSTSTNTSRVTIPSGKAGYYMVQAQAMDNGENGGRRLIRVMKNGTANFAIEGIPGISVDPSSASLQTVINLAVGDYLEIAWYQNWSGGNMTVLGNGDPGNPMFAVTYLGA